MAKKKSKNNSQLFNLAAIVFGIAAICMIFVTCVNYNVEVLGMKSITALAGTAVVFGESEGALGFSFMALLPYILTLGGVALLVLKVLDVVDLEIVAFAAFVVAAVFFFLTSSFVVVSNETLGSWLKSGGTYSLGIGSILAGIFSAISALALVCKKYVKL